MSKTNLNSHLTAKVRDRLSFPAKFLLSNNLLKGEILDFGCGLGTDVTFLQQKGYDIKGYDPYFFPICQDKMYDTILCFYVLNVLEPQEQIEVLMDISQKLKFGGKAYFAVRRDIKYQGFRIHKEYGKYTYQCNVRLTFKSILHNDFCEIYEYQHYTYLNKNKSEISPFLIDDKYRDLIVESATVFAFYDKFPVSKGHALVVPKRLVSDYFDLSIKEQTACWLVVNRVKSILQQKYNPNGFNVGININHAAGQTIPHVHIHIIPRYLGDMEDPRGGVRHVIPSKGKY